MKRLRKKSCDGRGRSACVRSGLSVVLAAWGLVAGLGAGCVSGTGSGRGGGSPIQQLHLFSTPVAVDFDATPGADGFAVRIYATNGREAKGVPITRGQLDLLLYDGTPAETGLDAAKPLRVWSYPARDLKGNVARSPLGVGYRFALPWGEHRPTRDRVTLVARYVAPSGAVVRSAPTTIALVVR
ncbi:MAG TPA: hypothetical protein VNO52_00940 [Methylomirabilota bacterium]|nr:hypothetical protein [Methylomirabilota bacterium]